MTEQQIHRAIIHHLEARAAPNVFWLHIPNGGSRRPVEAKIFRSLGVVPGTPDLCFVKKGRAYFLELKSSSGRLSEAQENTLLRLRECGALTCHVHSLNQGLRLEAWGLLRGRAL